MESELSDTPPQPAHVEAELIERIYKIALEPHSYDDFMEKWDSYISDAVSSLAALKRESHGERISDSLSRHFDMGFRLLEELGRSTPATFFADSRRSSGAPAILINGNGQVVWYNGSASRYFGVKHLANISDLPLWDGSRAKLDAMIEQIATGGNGQSDQSVLRMRSKTADKTLFMLADFVQDGSDEQLIHIRQVVSTWQESVGRMLAESFSLSTAEIEIAECLVEGAGIAEIAGRRSSSVNTVRTQVKNLLSKTGAGSQTELVRLLMSLNKVSEQKNSSSSHVSQGQPSGFRQRSGRLVPFHMFGPHKGKPVIFLHGMLDGCDLPARAVELLHEHDISLIAPERPFFGSAEGDNDSVKTAPERFALDIEDLLDHLKIRSAPLLGHMAGSVYAFATAAHLGDRVSAVVSVSGGVPIVSNEQFAFMSPRQQLVAYTARYTPKLLPFVLRAGIRQLDFGGEKNFMNALYEHSPHDLRAVADDEISNIICSGYHFTVAQGHRAFEIDSYHVVRDWTWRVEASQAPVVLIHGLHDPVVSARSVEAFAKQLSRRAKLVIDEGSGQMLFYDNPELIIRELAALG
jgi:pimeloyl-ACP methyl ester carboxylesterase/DNA-binding CsgD family transcriptional regulator